MNSPNCKNKNVLQKYPGKVVKFMVAYKKNFHARPPPLEMLPGGGQKNSPLTTPLAKCLVACLADGTVFYA